MMLLHLSCIVGMEVLGHVHAREHEAARCLLLPVQGFFLSAPVIDPAGGRLAQHTRGPPLGSLVAVPHSSLSTGSHSGLGAVLLHMMP